jgi:hypothetical protein
LDKKVPYKQDEVLYYAVAWRLKELTAGDDLPDNTDEKYVQDSSASQTGYWQISNIARVVPSPSYPASTPPDWHRTPSVAEIFPAFARLLRIILAELEKLAEQLASSLDVLSAYVAFLRSEVSRYEAIVNRILDLLAQITLKFQMPAAGVYVRGWKGKGGNTYFLTDLMNSLSDVYPDAPPFHDGDEYVAGAVLLAGGPLPSVTAFIEGISLLFGKISEDVQDLLEQAEDEVSRAEQIQLLDDFTIGTPEVTNTFEPLIKCTPQPAEEIQFNDDFTPKG